MLNVSRWKTIVIWCAVLLSVIFVAPNLFSNQQLAALPGWLPLKKVRLGLDLQGGSQLMLMIERDDILRNSLETTVDGIRAKLREASIRYSGLTGTGQTIRVSITDPAQVPAAIDALKSITNRVGTGTIGLVQETTITPGDNGLLTIRITNEGIDRRIASALATSMNVVRGRVEQLGNAEPLIQRQGSDRILVQVPGVADPQRIKNLLNQAGQLTFRMVDQSMPVEQAIQGSAPVNSDVLYTQDDPPAAYLVEKRAILSGDRIADAQEGLDPKTNEPVVTFQLDADGTKAFAQATQQNIGRSFVVVLDDQVIAALPIAQANTTGAGEISGGFSERGASDLAVLLRTGALPATLTVVEERTVGPGLGLDSIRSGIIAGMIGAIAVIACMVYFYGFLGIVATVALYVNILMILAILSLTGATLTLPGIAGIVLIIGMAVDSNVLIYERVREELKAGRQLPEACDAGFKRAFWTIIDANITTLIAAVILFYMGSGPVRGFAVTLAIGILTTVFIAFTLTQWIIVTWIKRRRLKHLPKDVRTAMFDRAHIRFMGIRRFSFTASAALSLCAMIALATVGMHLGIDFNGGSIIEVRAKQGAANLADIRTRLNELNLGEIQAQSFGDRAGALIRIQSQEGGENGEQSAVTLVRDELGNDYDFRRVEVVGPSVSGELTRSATLGVLASLAVVLIYIWFRFEWQFAIGAIVATLHDIILTLGLFVLTGIEFNLTSIAAVLMIIGYSLNDTVVVYDRMRENLKRYSQMPLPILIDASINQTLSRTILTAATTLLALLALCLFGGEVIRAFAFTMLFGVAVGTFSSIYIAAPFLIVFKLRPDRFQTGGDKKQKAAADVQPNKPAV
jgi:SecD/SecF fusion protein